MAWIRTIPPDDADPALREIYAALREMYPPEYMGRPESLADVEDERGRGGIMATHSLIPAALHHSFAAFAAMLAPDLPLTRRQQEMITTTVSALNRCYY